MKFELTRKILQHQLTFWEEAAKVFKTFGGGGLPEAEQNAEEAKRALSLFEIEAEAYERFPEETDLHRQQRQIWKERQFWQGENREIPVRHSEKKYMFSPELSQMAESILRGYDPQGEHSYNSPDGIITLPTYDRDTVLEALCWMVETWEQAKPALNAENADLNLLAQALKAFADWAANTFEKQTALSKSFHLIDEAEELNEALQNQAQDRRLEFADCFALLFGAAFLDGMNYKTIAEALFEKLEIVKKRDWGKPDENDVVRHKKAEEKPLIEFSGGPKEWKQIKLSAEDYLKIIYQRFEELFEFEVFPYESFEKWKKTRGAEEILHILKFATGEAVDKRLEELSMKPKEPEFEAGIHAPTIDPLELPRLILKDLNNKGADLREEALEVIKKSLQKYFGHEKEA